MSSIPAGSQGKLPHESPKNTFSIPNPCPREEAKGKGYSQVLQGDLWVQLLHHLPGQQQRHGEKQQETEKPVLIQSPHRALVLFNNIHTEKQLPCRTDRASMPKEHLGSLGTKSEFTRD